MTASSEAKRPLRQCFDARNSSMTFTTDLFHPMHAVVLLFRDEAIVDCESYFEPLTLPACLFSEGSEQAKP